MMDQPSMLVFRCNKLQPVPEMHAGVTFGLITNGFAAIRIAPAYCKSNGIFATVKMIAKLSTAKRFYYAAQHDGRIVSDGWILAGWCSSYQIGPCDYVIGPIQTASSERGLGLARQCLVRGINFCLERGAEWVYIDTTTDNIASRRAIEKSGMIKISDVPSHQPSTM